MNVTKIIDAFGYVIYAALAFLAVWGVYNGILLYRGLAKKSLADPQALIDRSANSARRGSSTGHQSLPEPDLLAHGARAADRGGLKNRDKGIAKIKQLVVTEFHSEVIAGMENRLGSISTIVRMGRCSGCWARWPA